MAARFRNFSHRLLKKVRFTKLEKHLQKWVRHWVVVVKIELILAREYFVSFT